MPAARASPWGFVLDLLPDNTWRIASPFMGGGSVEIALARELGLPVAAYDVFDILCAYWQVQLRSPAAPAKRLRAFPPDLRPRQRAAGSAGKH